MKIKTVLELVIVDTSATFPFDIAWLLINGQILEQDLDLIITIFESFWYYDKTKKIF